jgi:hypothetical protein
MYEVSMNERHTQWARRALSAIAATLGGLSLLLAAPASEGLGWSNERTILYAAEGGLRSPREALMNTLLLLGSAFIWLFVFGATVSPPNTRARRVLRAVTRGTVLVLGFSAGAGVLCGDLPGHLLTGGMVVFPLVLVGAAVRRWAMQAASPP